jgi:NAD(P)-dependent dehydrogenase (short-subunit alcohol dehydrogenase family)
MVPSDSASPDKPLADQVAVVAGGGGIGRAIALALAGAGAEVVIGNIVPERCEETVERVRGLGRRALGIPTDVMDTAQIETLVTRAVEEFDRLDILVNNAGGVTLRPFLKQSERSWRKRVDLNLISMFAATSTAAPIMIKGGRGGAVLNVTSIEGSRAAPYAAVYSACKAGMNNFTRTMAVELSDHGIRVSAIAPDFTPTPSLRKGPVDPTTWVPFTPQQQETMARRIPLGRGGLESECGAAALYLCSPMASYVTGVILPVDGGTWASGGWVRSRTGKWVLSEVAADPA